MVNQALKAEQQLKAAKRYYDRKPARESTRIEKQPTLRRLTFVDPSDGLALERIMGKSDLVGINYLEFGLLASRPVCRIQIVNPYGRTEGYGTGFLVGSNLLLTNNHVLEKPELAMKSFAEFDFEEDTNSRRKPTKTFDLRPGEVFVTDKELDFTFVSVAPLASDGTSLSNYGILRLVEEPGKVQSGEYVSIIQHPEGGLKQCCLRENEVVDIFDDWLQYLTDTEPGSSGSPVFNDQWLVVSLHHSGIPKMDAEGKILKSDNQPFREGIDDPSTIAWVANEGVRVSRIFEELETRSAADTMAAEALRRLRIPGTGPKEPSYTTTASGKTGGTPMEIGELATEHYRTAEGYDPNFLSCEHHLGLPTLAADLQPKIANLKEDGEVLTYHHFSIVMNAERRLAFFTAVNIDGRQLQNIERNRDKWYIDQRLDKRFQAGPELYASNPLDRGHLVRRLDPCWGQAAVAAGEDTFHFTNCSPQHAKLNQRDWLEVENYVLGTADNADVRISVFTGPVFRADDMLYRGYQLPADFWKVVAFVNKNGQLRATAYLRSQKNYLESLEFFDDEYKTWQVPVAQVEALTGLSFGIPSDADPMTRTGGSLESQRRNIRQIWSASDILL
ncbi:MAG: DNA/RNA non-specific endonuclease [Methanotrichaceae archaeon]|nr:DNA/RNA non-specific endonuclease [Methanotrichaceae archaeon]